MFVFFIHLLYFDVVFLFPKGHWAVKHAAENTWKNNKIIKIILKNHLFTSSSDVDASTHSQYNRAESNQSNTKLEHLNNP